MFHLSTYKKYLKFFDYEKVIGKIKDEFKGKIADDFVGLKSKRQFIKDIDGKENKTGKGVNKNFVKNIKDKKYIDILFNKKVVRLNMKRIQSKSHRTETYNIFKISLSCFDERHILDDGINTLAYFHKK